MTEQQFNTYKFSINTEVRIKGKWKNIIAVDFGRETIETMKSLHHISEVEDIRQVKV